MKKEVFFRTFGWPLLFANTILWPPYDKITFRLLLLICIVMWIILRVIFFNKKKYLANINITDKIIEIESINLLLKCNTLQLNSLDFREVKLSWNEFHSEGLLIVKLNTDDQTYRFVLLGNKIKMAKQKLTASKCNIKEVRSNFYLYP